MRTEYMYDIHNELMQINKSGAADRARGAAMIMEHYGDKEMADTLRLLSGQLDFDDSGEAGDAIKRTNEKLDKLIEEREKHHASSYISYLTDDMVRALSGGEVTDLCYSSVESSFLRHGLFDPDIFGGSGKIPYFDDEHNKYPIAEYGTGMGHIQLPCHVVLESSYQTIAYLLGQKKEDIKKLAKYVSVVVTDPGDSDLKVGMILTEKEYAEYADKNVSVDIGGDAIYNMLKSLNYSDQPERLVFSVVPVISPTARPIAYSLKEEAYYCDPLNRIYEKIVNLSQRFKRLQSLGMPPVISNNERRMIGDAVNELERAIAKQNAKRLCKNNVYAIHDFYQRMIVGRCNMVNAVYIPSEKTGEIESLGVYPETIRVQSEDRTYKDVSLSHIIDTCDDVMYQFEKDHTVVIPNGVDPDHLPADLQAKVDESEEGYHKMEVILDAIFDGSKKQREAFTVRLDVTGMYVPCDMAE